MATSASAGTTWATTWRGAATTTCCPSWTCSTCTAWPEPAARRKRARCSPAWSITPRTCRARWRRAWQRVCIPASRGLLAHARGDWQGALEGLGAALPRLLEIGGSHAQRDLFAQVHLDAMVKSGRLSAAQDLLQQQVRAQPESKRLKRQAAKVYASLGLPSVAANFF